MRLICFWCFLLAAAIRAQESNYYAPQTFRNHVDSYHKGLFTRAGNDVPPQSTNTEPWRSKPVHETWSGPSHHVAPVPAPVQYPKPEPWRAPQQLTKEQQASILHHKQALTSEGGFRFEYSSDNGLSAGEVIEPDGSRVGSYQYKDPNGQLVKLKYRAGKEGFQILEGSHLPKSPEPVPPINQDTHYANAYQQQRDQYQLQQNYNQQRPEQAQWRQNQNQDGGQHGNAGAGARVGGQYFVQNWRPSMAGEDDGQYRENGVEDKGPHTFGEGYSFAFQG